MRCPGRMKYLMAIAMIASMLIATEACAHYDGELLPDSVAVMEYRMIISMKPDDTLTRNKLGMVYIRQNKLDKARAEFLEVLKVNGSDFDALDSLGIVSDKEGKFEESAGWYEKALEVKDDAGVMQRMQAAKEKAGLK